MFHDHADFDNKFPIHSNKTTLGLTKSDFNNKLDSIVRPKNN